MHVHVAVDQATTQFGPLLTCCLGPCWLQSFNSDRRGTFRHGTLFGRGRIFEPNAGEIQKKTKQPVCSSGQQYQQVLTVHYTFLMAANALLHVLRTHTANTFQKKRTFLHLSSQSKKKSSTRWMTPASCAKLETAPCFLVYISENDHTISLPCSSQLGDSSSGYVMPIGLTIWLPYHKPPFCRKDVEP